MSLNRKERIAELVRQIPRNTERKNTPAPPEIQALLDKIKGDIESKWTTFRADLDTLNKTIVEMKEKGIKDPENEKIVGLIQKRIDGLQAELNRPVTDLIPPVYKSLGDRFIEHADVKSFIARGWHKGGVAMQVTEHLFGAFDEFKTTITSSAVGSSTPGILVPERVGFVPKTIRRLTVRDLLPQRPTTANAVEYVKENVFTNAASPVVEANDKPESALTFTIAVDYVRLIAHWIPASRQILDDLPMLAAFIDNRLLYGLKLKEETELLNGDNLGQHLNGLTTRATAYAGTYNVSGDTKIDKIRHFILEAEDDDEIVSGIVLNPKDWHDIQLIKTEEGGANKGMYIMGEPGGGLVEVPTLWGLPVVRTNSMASGKALVGAFATQAEIFDRMAATIDISTEHSDYFIKNLVAVRAEERLALAVYRPSAFIYGSI